MSKPYLASLSAVNSIPQQTPAEQIQCDIESWLAQGNQIKQYTKADYVEGKQPPRHTAAYRVLEMLKANTLAQPRDLNAVQLPTYQINGGVAWLRKHGWQIRTVKSVGFTGYELVRE